MYASCMKSDLTEAHCCSSNADMDRLLLQCTVYISSTSSCSVYHTTASLATAFARLLQSPFTMRCHQESLADAQGRHAVMPPFDWRPEGAQTFPLNCPQFVRTIIAASQDVLTILQGQHMGDSLRMALERILEASDLSIKTCIT